ncbi:Warthog protein, partial [Aphelenchoides avenae]
ALLNGRPVLGCARPSCFGWAADGARAGVEAIFYKVHAKPDGFLRRVTPDAKPKAVNSSDAQNFQPQTATCAARFVKEQCPNEHMWVGGIEPLKNASSAPLALRCCEYEPLRLSENRGIAVVKPGQIVVGGEVFNGDRQYAFDYISDIAKHMKKDGTTVYDVSIRRLPCLPYPKEFSVKVEDDVTEDLIRRFLRHEKNSKKHAGSVAFGASNVRAEQIQVVPSHVVDNDIEFAARGAARYAASSPNVADSDLGHESSAPHENYQASVGASNYNTGPSQLVSHDVHVARQEESPIVRPAEPSGQITQVLSQTQNQGPVENLHGPFVPEQGAVVEEVPAVDGFELPAGQVPQGIVNPSVEAVIPASQAAGPLAPAVQVAEVAPAVAYAPAIAYVPGVAYYPVGTTGGGGGGQAFFCFSGDTKVLTSDGVEKRMDQLKVDDWVLSSNGTT